MRPAYKVHVVFVQKFGHHISPEGEGDTAVVLPPAQHVLVWVSPQQVTQQTLVRHVRGPHDPADLLHGLEIGREAWGDITPLFESGRAHANTLQGFSKAAYLHGSRRFSHLQ